MRTLARYNDGELKGRIDAAALHLFAERGAAATPMQMIAEEAGVAVGSLYRYYESKEALVARLFADNYAALARALDEVQLPAAGIRAKLAAMTRFICGYFDREWDLARFLLLEQHSGLREYADPANPIDVIDGVIAAGIEAGELPPGDPIVAAALVIGPVVQAATLRTYGRLGKPLTEIADELAAATWRAVAASKRGTE
jgi:AcrR family transcriptional regulator